MKVLLIPVDGPRGAVDLPDGGGTRFMRSLRTLIGTRCAERIWITSRWEAWLDEDGAAAGEPANRAATLVGRSFGAQFSLCGTVVITGLDTDTAEPASLSPAQAGAVLGKIRAPSASRPPGRGGGAAWTRGRAGPGHRCTRQLEERGDELDAAGAANG